MWKSPNRYSTRPAFACRSPERFKESSSRKASLSEQGIPSRLWRPEVRSRSEFPRTEGAVVVVVDNSDGKVKVGQTVYVPLIPRQPVVEVPNSAIGNLSDGHRKVQVVRQFIVRDISVSLLGQVGSTRVFVSGPFADG